MKKLILGLLLVATVSIPTAGYAQSNNQAYIQNLLNQLLELQKKLLILLYENNTGNAITETEKIDIKTRWSFDGWDGDYKLYTLYLSGGTEDKGVHRWKLDFNCPTSIINEVIVKVAGDICETNEDYVLGGNNPKGDTKIPLRILLPRDASETSLEIDIEAVDASNEKLGEVEFTLPISEEDSTGSKINIETKYSLDGFNGDHKEYKLYLSGGTRKHPVKEWQFDFTCPSNIEEVLAKVWGDVCGANNYRVGVGPNNNYRGDLDIPLNIIHKDFNVANLKIDIRAIGKNGEKLDEIEYILPVHKG